MAKKNQKRVIEQGNRIHTEEAIKQRGEVFTPTPLVNEMLDKLPKEVFTDPTKTFLDNSCGNGQFLFEVMRRKMEVFRKHNPKGRNFFKIHRLALLNIFGVELDPKNAEECRKRLLGKSDSIELRELLRLHIICADALDPKHPGWEEVGFYWSKLYPDSN